MIDVVLLAGRLLLLALLYLFLFAAIQTGIGLVAGQRKKGKGAWVITVLRGPGRHARISPAGDGAVVEDLSSTNGTVLNGVRITAPQQLRPGDTVDIGSVRLKVDRS